MCWSRCLPFVVAEGSKIYLFFHVSLLKRFEGVPEAHAAKLPIDATDNGPVLSPLAICATKQVMVRGKLETMVLGQWEGHPPEDSMWELAKEIAATYLHLHLEDKVLCQVGGNDKQANS